MSFSHGFKPADILLPARPADCARWAVIACDQYTSQRAYWDAAAELVGDAPSALNIIQPEIDLDRAEERLPFIRGKMNEYLCEGALTRQVTNGFVLTLRRTHSGERPGLIGMVDLEQYEFTPGTDRPVRASEGTIIERIPPRMRIREGAVLECPHIMLLADDPEGLLVERTYESVKNSAPIYDFELMLGGGHLTGRKVEGEAALKQIDEAVETLYRRGKGFLFAVGDGNHSLATAKACWDRLKPALSEEERQNHPSRYALVEIVNLHCPALVFRPIHRVLFGTDADTLAASFAAWLEKRGRALLPGGSIEFSNGESYRVSGAEGLLDTVFVQPWLDEFLKENPGVTIDYVHGEEAVDEICRSGAAGIKLGTIDKGALFPSVKLNGVLPRKSFSMGEADEKRFYMEVRKIL